MKSSISKLTQRIRDEGFGAALLNKTTLKPFNEIPSPEPGNQLKDSRYLHERCSRLHADLGVIYRDLLGDTEMVFIADSSLTQTVLANEGIYPRLNVPLSWIHYNEVRNIKRGLFFQSGPTWKRMREVSNRVLLKDTSNIYKFSKSLMDINHDMFKQWNSYSVRSNSYISVNDLKFDLCKWSIEATSYMLFKKRLGCLSPATSCPNSQRAGKLVDSVARMFNETTKLNFISPDRYESDGLEVWNQFKHASDSMLEIANSYTRENIKRLKENPECDGLLRGFLESDTLTEDEISSTMIDFIVAAADTTSSAMQWMLYLISRHPQVEEKLFNEVNQVLTTTTNLDECKENLPYLRGFIKETSRFYPTAPFLSRTLDKDIALADYLVPANTPIVLSLYATSRSDNYFVEPEKFKPERWLRTESVAGECPMKKTGYSLASLPFGIGARNCVGRKMAELQMCLFLAAFVQTYTSHPVGEDIGIKLNMILSPSSPIQLKLKPR